MSQPWMPLYVADYLADTRRLSTLEHGAYMLLIMDYWRNGALPDDDRKLARIAGLGADEWAAMRDNIAELFLPGWRHKRIDQELARSAERSDAARISASKRWNKRGNANADANALPEQCGEDAGEMLSQPQSQPKKDKHPLSLAQSSRPKKGGGDIIDDIERFWAAFPNSKGMSQRRAAEQLMQMSPADRKAAIDALPAFTEHSRKNPTTHPLSAEKYLAERRFDGFAPQASTGEPKVFVKHGTPEWKLWEAHWRATKGTGPPCGKNGYYFPTLVPPQPQGAGISI